ncbi:MAG: DNA mismatch repair endonuclease MutL [Rikenellaceae bacterium]
MGVIELLSATVADQIAAGEVVNRPAAVVKELLENAVDAGAQNIVLKIVDAGHTMIQIIDDGCGMSPEDALMAYKRHATSKIRSADDLFALSTFGFRGEALPSIASVTQLEMKTRREQDELGIEVTISGGEFQGQRSVQCDRGTSIAVRNIFYNTPARRKFLRTIATERKQILIELERVAMVNPQICFTYQNENDTPVVYRATTQRQRVGELIKKQVDKSLLPVEVSVSHFSLKGWISEPHQYAKSTVSSGYFFINGRFMKNLALAKAVVNGYGRLLPQGAFPYFYLFMQVDPTQIDVNIHPTKTEVKFEDEQTIWQLVNTAVRRTLGSANVAPTIDFANPVSIDIPAYRAIDSSSLRTPKTTDRAGYNPFAVETPSGFSPMAIDIDTPPSDGGFSRNNWAPASEFDPEQIPFTEDIPDYLLNRQLSSEQLLEQQAAPSSEESFEELESLESSYGEFVSQESFSEITSPEEQSEFIEQPSYQWQQEQAPSHQQSTLDIEYSITEALQWGARYLITTHTQGVVVIDYPRALERISYERLMRTINLSHAGQKLLMPEMIDMTLAEAQQLLGVSEELATMGLEIVDMGSGSISIYSMPSILIDKISPGELIAQITEAILGNMAAQNIKEKIVEAISSSTSRIRPTTLSESERVNIINELFCCSEPAYTPSGLPVIHKLEGSQIEKFFKRR